MTRWRPDWTFKCPKCPSHQTEGPELLGEWDNLCRGLGYISADQVEYGIARGAIRLWQQVGEAKDVKKT